MMLIDGFIVEELFNLKFAAKQMERSAVKCEKDEKTEKGKLKKVINPLICIVRLYMCIIDLNPTP